MTASGYTADQLEAMSDEDLEEAVLDMTSHEGCEILNAGRDAQTAFLLGGPEDEPQPGSGLWVCKMEVTVLCTGKELLDFDSLAEAHYAITDGDCMGTFDWTCRQEVTREAFIAACYNAGGEPGFFSIDDAEDEEDYAD